MTTSATMTTMVMTITVRAVFFMRKHVEMASRKSRTPRTAQFSTSAMRSTLAVVCPTAKYPPSAAA